MNRKSKLLMALMVVLSCAIMQAGYLFLDGSGNTNQIPHFLQGIYSDAFYKASSLISFYDDIHMVSGKKLIGSVTGDVSGDVSGNAGTVTNGVYTGDVDTASVANKIAKRDANACITVEAMYGKTVKLTDLTDDYIPYHVNDATGFANGPTKTNVDSAINLKHDSTLQIAKSILTEQGDMMYRDGTGPVALVHGTAGDLLQSGGHGANPSWLTPSATATANSIMKRNAYGGAVANMFYGDLTGIFQPSGTGTSAQWWFGKGGAGSVVTTSMYAPADTGLEFGIANSCKMFMDHDGHLGIGNTAPGYLLDARNTARLGDSLFGSGIELNGLGTGNRYAVIDLVGDATYTDYGLRIIRDNTGANATNAIQTRGTGDLSLRTEEAGDIVLSTTNVERMHILANGNVGIGTASPTSELTVVDSGNLDKYSGTVDIMAQNLTRGISIGYQGITATGSNATADLSLDSKSTGNILLQTVGTGNVGIGTASPAAKADVLAEVHTDASIVGIQSTATGHADTMTSRSVTGIRTDVAVGGLTTGGTFTGCGAYGVYATVQSSWGVLPTAVGLYAQGRVFTAQTTTNYYGLLLDNKSLALGAAITNNYGVYQNDTTAINVFNGTIYGNGFTHGTAAYAVTMDANHLLYHATSSRRYKYDIKVNQIDSTKLLNLEPKAFMFKEQRGVQQTGFIAEEVAEVMPEIVRFERKCDVMGKHDKKDKDGNFVKKGILIEQEFNDTSEELVPENIDWNAITTLLVEENKRQQKLIDDLISRIEKLEKKP